MHEMSIAQSLVDILKEEMARNDAASLKSVKLRIGKMSAIVPESLSFCFQVMTEGTAMEGAELIMDLIPLRGHCRKCGNNFEIENYSFECIHCGSTEIDTVAGQDLSIVEMEVD